MTFFSLISISLLVTYSAAHVCIIEPPTTTATPVTNTTDTFNSTTPAEITTTTPLAPSPTTVVPKDVPGQ